MRTPIIVVTGGIATGKTTVAVMCAERGGTLIDCDAMGHAALDSDEVRRGIVDRFGPAVLTRAGRVSRAKLGRAVFSDGRMLETLNAVIRPVLERMIQGEVSARRKDSEYIVLDAVLFFQYTFRFKADLVIRTVAPRETRIARLEKRDGMTRLEALKRIERQRYLEEGWRTADVAVRTDVPMPILRKRVSRIRDRFLDSRGLLRGSG